MFKTILQIIAIFTPITYWNFNVDTVSSKEGLLYIFIGIAYAVLIELGYWFYKNFKK